MVFFRKYLSEAVADPAINASVPGHGGRVLPLASPSMLTIGDFFQKATAAVPADKVSLILSLYDVYRASLSEGQAADSLDDFVFWGDMILSDFDDVDKYLADADRLFVNISDLHDIGDPLDGLDARQLEALSRLLAHFGGDAGGRVKKEFRHIWNLMAPMYKALNEELSSQGLAYEGMIYRRLAEKVKEEGASALLETGFTGTEKMVFVGLNALNNCEKVVLGALRREGLAEFCWDFGGDVMSDPENQASRFMEENMAAFPQAFELEDHDLPRPEINVVAVPSATAQTTLLPHILKESRCPDWSDFAIVLPDESLLVPVLNSIPPEIPDINVTMGYPMASSSMYSLMNALVAMQMHLRRSSDGKWSFYHKQVSAVFANEIFRRAAGPDGVEYSEKLLSLAKYYMPQEDFDGNDFFRQVFRPVVTDPAVADRGQIAALENYLSVLVTLFGKTVAASAELGIETEFARRYLQSLNLLASKQLTLLPQTYSRLLGQLTGGASVPFNGEPLKGLQIMGPLEMRALDFSTLVIMSANEAVFPRRSVSASFIPPQLREAFGLPTYVFQDRVWAYYFYRMVRRAGKIWMLYDSRTEGVKSGEESRYIKQIDYLYRDYFDLHRFVLGTELKAGPVTPPVKQASHLEPFFSGEKRLSATALGNYLGCPAKFYYGSVLGLSEDRQVAESLDNGMIGSVFHAVMQSIYFCPEAMAADVDVSEPHQAAALSDKRLKYIDEAYIRLWLGRKKAIEAKIRALMVSKMNGVQIAGRDLVTLGVIRHYVIKTLERDLETLKGGRHFEIKGLELRRSMRIGRFSFTGIIDRLDSLSPGTLRIVDYKTGKVRDEEISIRDEQVERLAAKLFDHKTSENDRPKIAFQLYLYDKMLSEDPEFMDYAFENCIYQISELFKGVPPSSPVSKAFIEEMDKGLQATLQELSDLSVPWNLTEDTRMCAYCDFKDICGR